MSDIPQVLKMARFREVNILSCGLFMSFIFCVICFPYTEKYFDQQVDHFNFLSYGHKTFKQRYLIQDKWWTSNHSGPIFFYTGNEGAITEFYDLCGFVMEAAEQFNALVVFAEHRYYGKSMPFGNSSFSVPNVGLLTVEQALADYAVLITHLKRELKATTSPVIVFGGSYGGMLSAYMRFKYPNVVDGAIAASAPIYLVGGVVGRDFFFEDITKDFMDISPNCVQTVKQAFMEMKLLYQQGEEGLKELSSIFQLCHPITTDDQYRHLLGWIRNAFVYLAMFDYPYPTQFFPMGYPVKRYYGKSMPFGNSSFSVPNVGLLTVEQALADYAVLITHLKRELKATTSPVVVFGGSYGGMLSAYMRFKYPNVVDGAIAASAPIYLVGGVVGRDFFFEDITKDFMDVSPYCVQTVKQAFVEMKLLHQQGDAGLKKLSSYFHLCHPITTDDQYRHLLGWIRNAFVYLAMFDYPYPTQFFPMGYPVKSACSMLEGATDPLDGLRQAIGMYYNGSSSTHPCYDIYSDFIECADPTGCGLGPSSKAWDYQACTEMLMPAGSNNVTDMFPELPFTLGAREEYCMKKWSVSQRYDWFGVSVWGKDITSASNIVFSNGDLDPWHRGGVNSTLTAGIVSLRIKDGAHHLDLRASDQRDPPSVTKARHAELAFIQKWVSEAQTRRRN